MENKNENAVIRKIQVPLWHKMNLSIDEAAAYSGIGRDKLYEMTNKAIQNASKLSPAIFYSVDICNV